MHAEGTTVETGRRRRKGGDAMFSRVALAVATGAACLTLGLGPAEPLSPPAQTDELPFAHVDTWQSRPVPPPGVVFDPVRLFRATDGTLFVTDRHLHRIQRFTLEGEPLEDYGIPGKGAGQLLRPMAAAADIGRRRVYVADTDNNRVAVFDLGSEFVANWAHVVAPIEVDVAPSGEVVVRDAAGFVVFSPDGAVQERFPSLGSPVPTTDLTTGGIAMAGSTILEAVQEGVARYSLKGEPDGFHPQFRSRGIVARDIGVSELGKIYVLQDASAIVRVIGGQALPRLLGGTVTGVAAVDRDELIVAKAATRDRRAGIVHVRYTGSFQEQQRWGDPLTILGWINNPLRITSRGGDLFITDEIRRVQRLDATGEALGQVTLPGIQDAVGAPDGDVFAARERYGVDGNGDEDVEDPEIPPPGMRRYVIERLSFGGAFVSAPKNPAVPEVVWRDTWTEPDELSATHFMAADAGPDGTLYLLDAGKRRVFAYAATGGPPTITELPDLRAGLPGYTDLGVAADGRVQVMHTAARRLITLDAAGDRTAAKGLPDWPWRFEPLDDGRTALITARGWLWVLNADGTVLSTTPLPESRFDTGEAPSDVTAVGDRVYVTDRSGTAVFVFEPSSAAPPSEAPPPGDLACTLEAVPAIDVREVKVSEVFTVTLAVRGECEVNGRSQIGPPELAVSLDVEVALPPGVSVEGVGRGGRPSGNHITWALRGLGHAGTDLWYAVRAEHPGRTPAFETLRGRYRDGWYEVGELESPSPYVLVRPETPQFTAWLPALWSQNLAEE